MKTCNCPCGCNAEIACLPEQHHLCYQCFVMKHDSDHTENNKKEGNKGVVRKFKKGDLVIARRSIESLTLWPKIHEVLTLEKYNDYDAVSFDEINHPTLERDIIDAETGLRDSIIFRYRKIKDLEKTIKDLKYQIEQHNKILQSTVNLLCHIESVKKKE